MEENGFVFPVASEQPKLSIWEKYRIRYLFQDTVNQALQNHQRHVELMEDHGGYTQALQLSSTQVDGSIVGVLISRDEYEGVVHLLFNGGEHDGSMRQYYLDETTRDVLLYGISKNARELYERRITDIIGTDPAFAHTELLNGAVQLVYEEQAANRRWEQEWGLNDQPIDLTEWHYLNNVVQNGVPFE